MTNVFSFFLRTVHVCSLVVLAGRNHPVPRHLPFLIIHICTLFPNTGRTTLLGHLLLPSAGNEAMMLVLAALFGVSVLDDRARPATRTYYQRQPDVKSPRTKCHPGLTPATCPYFPSSVLVSSQIVWVFQLSHWKSASKELLPRIENRNL